MFINSKRQGKALKEPFCLYRTRPEKNETWREQYNPSEYSDLRNRDLFQLPDVTDSERIKIEVNSKKTIVLSTKLSELAKAIEESLYILELDEDFDDEESSRYEFNTWERAIDFLVNYAKWALDAYYTIIESPKIYHGPDGSIDILWKNQKYKLLINIPKENDCPASFYGDDYDMDKIKGTFDTSKCNRGLLMLLLKSI